jgi:hypothetical protein
VRYDTDEAGQWANNQDLWRKFMTKIVFATVLLAGTSCLADPIIGLPSPIPAIYDAGFVGTGLVSQNVFNNTGVSIAASTPPGADPSAYAAAKAEPNLIGVASAVATNTNAESSTAVAFVDDLDYLYMINAPKQGILKILVSIQGSGSDTGTDYFGPSSTVLYHATTLQSGTIPYGTGCVSKPAGAMDNNCALLFTGLGFVYVPYAVDIQLGTVELEQYLFTASSCHATPTPSSGSTCSSSTNYLDTVQIASITIEDVNGNPVPGASYVSLGGIDYSLPQQVTPEPSPLLLFGTGILCLAGCRGLKGLMTANRT